MDMMIDGIPFQLGQPFDFSFVKRWGRVFKVFDSQDSGNICFGTEREGERFFLKFAGAPTLRYPGRLEDAVARLKAATPLYEALAHPNLIQLVEAGAVEGGYLAVFR